jgi:hypothetical protein
VQQKIIAALAAPSPSDAATGSSAQAADHNTRLVRSKAAQARRRKAWENEVVPPWDPEVPPPDLPRLASAIEAADGDNPFARALRRLDVSPRVFGSFPGQSGSTLRRSHHRRTDATQSPATIVLRDSEKGVLGRPPRAYELTRKGDRTVVVPNLLTSRARHERKSAIISGALEKKAHHIGAVAWAVKLLDTATGMTGRWYTPAWTDGYLNLPAVHIPPSTSAAATAPSPSSTQHAPTACGRTSASRQLAIWNRTRCSGSPSR